VEEEAEHVIDMYSSSESENNESIDEVLDTFLELREPEV